jgi:hypothetical protein
VFAVITAKQIMSCYASNRLVDAGIAEDSIAIGCENLFSLVLFLEV